jgi:NADH-quinone oxidoreductase subunit K
MTSNPDLFFALAVWLVCVGAVAVATRRNIFVIYLGIETMLTGVNLVLATFARLRPDMGGTVVALLMIGVIAAEAALFLALIVQLYRRKRSVDAEEMSALAQRKWS